MMHFFNFKTNFIISLQSTASTQSEMKGGTKLVCNLLLRKYCHCELSFFSLQF